MSDIILADGILFTASRGVEGKSEDAPGYTCSQYCYRNWRVLTPAEITENADRVARVRAWANSYPDRFSMDCENAGWNDGVAKAVNWDCRVRTVQGGEMPWWHSAHGYGYEEWAAA